MLLEYCVYGAGHRVPAVLVVNLGLTGYLHNKDEFL